LSYTSAFALLFHRDGAAADPAGLGAVLRSLAHRGPDGCDLWTRGPFALGHQRFWTTPEEVGERQPLAGTGGRCRLLFDGRLDNRQELAAALGLEADGGAFSDAALVLRAYERWQERSLERLLGPFALAVVDLPERRVLLGRDALGDRTLFYVLRPELLAVASEESALLALPGVSSRLEEESLARFFAVQAPASGATFFAAVRELPPAHGIAVEGTRVRAWRHWEAGPEPRLRLRGDREYAERFAATLAAAVRCRLRSTAPVAVMMSGGLDSTAVAALAARERRGGGAGEVRTLSWTFDELAECDERRYMDAVVERWGLPALRFCGDDAWPLAHPESWPRNPNTPLEGLVVLWQCLCVELWRREEAS
jgi:asparagine synthase (glutamine-hydrolysing)